MKILQFLLHRRILRKRFVIIAISGAMINLKEEKKLHHLPLQKNKLKKVKKLNLI